MATARANLETTISADMSQYSATMRRAGLMAQTTGAKIGKGLFTASKYAAGLSVAMGGVAAVIGGGLFARGLKNAADLGGTLADLAARTGTTAGNVAILRRAFEDNGVSADKVGGVINKLQKSIFDFASGSEKAALPFQTLGISMADLAALDPAKQFALIQQKIAGIENPTARAAVAMQIFGKAGGELLTLFGDSGAFSNAAKFLGQQAEILNRRAATFDEISDILARSGEKLQGFFVGILDSVADPLLEILKQFDSLDLAKMGQDAGKFILEAVNMTGQMLDMAYQFGQRMANGIEAAGVLLRATFSGDFWVAQGKLIVAAMGDGVNVLKAGMEAAGAMLFATWQEMPSIVYNAFAFLADGKFWEVVKNSLLNVAMNFAMTLSEWLGKAFEMLKNMDFSGLKGIGEEIGKKILGNKTDGYSINIEGSIADSIDKIKQAGKDAFTGSTPMFDTEGLKTSAISVLAEVGKEWQDILNRPIQTLPEAVKGFVEKYAPAIGNIQGSGSMGPNDGLQAGIDRYRSIGQDNIFSKERSRLGLVSGLQTGSLGEKRRLKTSSDSKSEKKQLTLAERQAVAMESVDAKISKALTVS